MIIFIINHRWKITRLCWNRRAIFKWISCIRLPTSTQWHMRNDLTFSIETTYTRAWINAFISNTSLIRRTISIYNTFWSTAFIWISIIFWKTCTWSSTILFFTNSVSSARRWHTWRNRFWFRSLKKKKN